MKSRLARGKHGGADASERSELGGARWTIRARLMRRRRALAAALSLSLGLGALTTVALTPVSAATPLTCTADTVYMITSGGNVHQVTGDTGATGSSIYDGASSAGNQLGIKSGGLGAVNTDNAPTAVINDYNRTTTSISTFYKQSGSGTIAGAVDPRSGVYYYGGYGSGGSSNLLTLYAYNPANGSTWGPAATITAPSAPGGNGDIAFDTLGRLYLVASSASSSSLYVFSSTLPTASNQSAVSGTASQISTSSVSAAVNGIAFASNGYLYLGSGTTITKVDPTDGSTLGTDTLATTGSTDLASCATPTLVSVKVDYPRGRIAPTDQASIALTRVGHPPAVTGTTTGTEAGLQDQSTSEYAGPVLGFPGEAYTLAVTESGTSDFDDYTTSYECTVAETGAVVASGAGSAASITLPAGGGSTVECVVTLEAPAADLSFVKSVSPTSASTAGELLTYTFTAENTGGQVLTDFQIADPHPGLSAISCAPVALGGTLAIGASTTCTATYTTTLADLGNPSIDNTATATAAGNTPGDAISRPSTASVGVALVPPVATDDAATTTAEVAVTLPAVGNDSPGQVDGVPLVPGATVLTNPAATDGGTRLSTAEGLWQVNANGTVTFTPSPGFSGSTTPEPYRITDEAGQTATATLTVLVRPGTLAVPDTQTTLQGTPVMVDPRGNDDPGQALDGSPATWAPGSLIFTDPAATLGGKRLEIVGEGVYVVNPDETVTFTPEPAFTGPATAVEYRVTNSLGDTATSTITITVTPVPVANDDAENTPYATPVTLDAMTDDDPGAPGTPLVAASTVFPVAGQPAGATRSPDGKTLIVDAEGTWQVNPDGTVTFSPAPGFVGVTTPVVYEIADTNGTTDTAQLQVTVRSGPTAAPDATTTTQNIDVTVNPLDNDTAGLNSDGSGGGLDATSVRFPTGGQPAGATVAVDGLTLTVPGEGEYTVDPGTGIVTFDPEPGFTGDTTPVTYTAQDSVLDATGATVHNPITSTISIEVTGIRPVANDDSASTPFGTPVTLPAVGDDAAGDPSAPLVPANTRFPVIGQPASATVSDGGLTLTIAGVGVFTLDPTTGIATFTPSGGFSGTTPAVTYRIEDSNGSTDTAALQVTVRSGPAASADTASTPQNTDVTVSPLDNDTPGLNADGFAGSMDPTSVRFTTGGQPDGAIVSGDGLTITVPDEGVYTINPTTGVVTFDPEPAFTGVASRVNYLALDTVLDSSGATVHNPVQSTITITVTPVQPVADDDAVGTPFDTPVALPGLLDDAPGAASAPLVAAGTRFPTSGQPAGSVLSAGDTVLDVPDEGRWQIEPDGSVLFTPTPGFVGTTTTAVYEIVDSNGSTDAATLEVTVRARPLAAPDTATVSQGASVILSPLANDTPGPVGAGTAGSWAPDTVLFTASGQPAGAVLSGDRRTLTVPGEGTYVVDPDDRVIFTPAPTFTGTAQPVIYEATDSNGNPATTTITITVTPVTPVATDNGATTPYATPVTLTVVDDDTAGVGDCSPKTAGSLTPPNCPIALDPTTVELSGASLPAGTVIAADGKTLTIPAQGRFTVDPTTGDVTFTPEAGFSGPVALVDYTVLDANGTPAIAQLTIVVGDPGVVDPDVESTEPETPITVDILANDAPSPGQTWDLPTLCLVTEVGDCVTDYTRPGVGHWVVNPDGTVTFTPAAGYGGTAEIEYRVSDTASVAYASTLTLSVPAPAALASTGSAVAGSAPIGLIAVLAVALGAVLLIATASRGRRSRSLATRRGRHVGGSSS